MQSQGIIWSEEEVRPVLPVRNFWKVRKLTPSKTKVCWDRLAAYYDSRDIGHRARVVRMEQILVASPSSRRGAGALGKRTLHHALQLQSELERRLLSGSVQGLTCVRDEAGRCAIASPASWWIDEHALLDDTDVHRTLSLSSPYSTASNHSLPLTTTNTLVGVGRDLRGTVKGAKFLAITFFLEDSSTDMSLKGIGSQTEESARERSKAAWRKAVRDTVAGNGWPTPGVEQMGKTRETRGLGRRIILKVRFCLYPLGLGGEAHPRATSAPPTPSRALEPAPSRGCPLRDWVRSCGSLRLHQDQGHEPGPLQAGTYLNRLG